MVCPSVIVVVVVVGTKIARYRVLGVYACCNHNQSIDINCSKRLTSATNRAFSVQHACGLSTTPTLLACCATAHAQAQYWKGSSGHKTALQQSVAVLRYSGYRAHEYVLYRAIVTPRACARVKQLLSARKLLDLAF